MTGEASDKKKVEELDDDDEIDTEDDTVDTLTISTRNDDDDDDDSDSDNVGDMSVEINIEELVAKLDATDDDDVARQRMIKRRIEELREQRDAMRDLDETYNFNLDDDD